MTKLINKNKLNTFANKLWDKITASFVSKTLPNTVTGETMITNGYVGGESTVTKRHNETGINMVGLGVETGYFGIPSLSIPARTHIDKIVCIMHNDAGAIGDTVLGVNVGVVSKSTGRLLEYLKRRETTEIIENPISSGTNSLTGDKAISIPINRTWEEEVYFIVGAKGLLVGYINSSTPSVGGNDLKDIGYSFGNGTSQNYVGRIAIYTSKYSLNEVATKAFTSETDINTLKNDYVSKTKENFVSSKTTLLNGCVLNSAISIVNNTNATGVMTDGRFAGSSSLTARGNVHISYLCVAVDDSYEIGREISGIKIAAVSYDTNRVKEVITTSGKATVCENIYGHIDSRKVILYPIQKSYDVGVYFIVGFYGMKWGRRSNNNWLTVVPSNNFPGENTSITLNTSNWIYQAAIFAEETKLNEMLTSINTLSTSKAGISNANTFTDTNIFNGSVRLNENVDIRYVTKYEQPLLDSDNKHGSNWAVYFDRNIYIPAGSYVTHLDIMVTDDVNVGSELSKIYIYEVHRGDSISNDRIVSVLFDNSRFGVSNVDGYGKCIRAQLNKTFDRDTYCIIGQKEGTGKILRGNDGQGNIRRAITNNPFVLNSNYNISSISSETNDKVIHRYNIERVGILQDDIKNINSVLATTVKNTDVANAPNKIPRIGADGRLPSSILPPEQNGGVRMVNGQSPVDGNVTVLAEHIKYANGQNTTVKQEIANKINESDAVTSSQANKIVKLDGNGKINENMFPSSIIKTNLDNTFTKHNIFNDYSPTVHRLFTRKHINSNATGNTEAYTVNTYFAILNEKYTENNKQISHILIPIKNSQVGDVLDISFFTFNNNNQVNYIESYTRRCTVIDEEILGHKCAKIQVNRNSGTSGIGFGFMNMTHSIDGRQLGIACIRNTAGGNKIWSQTYSPRDGQTLSANTNATMAYKICYETTSAVVTRFELENVTQMYPRMIGEVKHLVYDCGDSFEDGMNTWLRVNGQAISKTEYPALFDKMNTSDDLEELQLLQVDDRVGYYYICVK